MPLPLLSDSLPSRRYQSVSLDQIVDDVVRFSEFTWVLVLAVFALHGLLAGTITYWENGCIGSLVCFNGIEAQCAAFATDVPLASYCILEQGRAYLKERIRLALESDFTIPDIKFMETTFGYDPEKVTCQKQVKLRALERAKAQGARATTPAGAVQGSADRAAGLDHILSMETYIARFLQAAMYVLCFMVARLLASWEFWNRVAHESWQHAFGDAMALFYYIIIFWLVTLRLLPQAVITATFSLGMPPFIDQDNLATIRLVMREKSMIHNKAGSEDDEAVPTMGVGVELEAGDAQYAREERDPSPESPTVLTEGAV